MRFRRHALQRSLWVVLPSRGIAQGKSRLASVLNAAERARFNRWLLAHTLRVVAAWQGGLSRCIVTSACSRVLHVARVSGAHALLEACPRGDLNRAIGRATRELLRRGAHRVLVLSCDMPWLSVQALDRLLDCAAAGTKLVIATDAAGTGTNALLLSARGRFPFSYGAESRVRHVTAARQRGWSALVVNPTELARDIDTPQDFALWQMSARKRGAPLPMI